MTKHLNRWARRVIIFILGVISVTVLVSCGVNSGGQPILTKSELVGSWVGPDGTLVFSPNQSFTGYDLKLGISNGVNTFCPSELVKANGTWSFTTPENMAGAQTYAPGKSNIIFVHLSTKSFCGFSLTSWEIRPPVGLCFSHDPDTSCGSPAFVKVSNK